MNTKKDYVKTHHIGGGGNKMNCLKRNLKMTKAEKNRLDKIANIKKQLIQENELLKSLQTASFEFLMNNHTRQQRDLIKRLEKSLELHSN